MIKWAAFSLLAGFLLDLLLGDPSWLYHPVCIIGNAISFLEKKLRRLFPSTEAGERAAGLILVLLIVAGSGGAAFAILYIGFRIHEILGICLESFMCYQMLAVKSLKTESMKVYKQLAKGSLEGGRREVSMIVGRDTAALDEAGVTKATVETIAENTSDGILAPMFYMILGGPVLMYMYKGINTMDSMVGYKNDKYLNFGRYAAKLDDIVNYIPARLSGYLMILASWPAGYDWKNAAKIYKRDRHNHASPNSAQTESVMAGALDVQLAGDAWYFGKLLKKPTIGDPIRAVEIRDIPRANRLLYFTAVLGAVIFAGLHTALLFLI